MSAMVETIRGEKKEREKKQTFREARGSEIDAGADDMVQQVHLKGVESLFVQIRRRDSTRDNVHLAGISTRPHYIKGRGHTIAHVMHCSFVQVWPSTSSSSFSLIHANIPSGLSTSAYDTVIGFVPMIRK